MSRVGKKPIVIPSGVDVKIEKSLITVSGTKGSLSQKVHPDVKVERKDGEVVVVSPNNSKYFRSLHGLYRSLIANMVEGVTNSYEKKLEIVGVGYKAEMKNETLSLQLGYSHAIVFQPPKDIEIKTETPTNISISGVSKELVGQVAAKIRSLRPPEPYKGKGIKYANEQIRRKAGKTAA